MTGNKYSPIIDLVYLLKEVCRPSQGRQNHGRGWQYPWVEEAEMEVEKNKESRIPNVVYLKEELHTGKTSEIYRSFPWVFNRIIISTCIWTTSLKKITQKIRGNSATAHKNRKGLFPIARVEYFISHRTSVRVLSRVFPQ